MKKITSHHSTLQRHWVGDGFPVRTLFSYNDLGRELSPFLLMDYAGPQEFPANPGARKGVDEHPHRGFETVTIVYDGQVEHRDSAGGGGVIGRGDVQWMTAASGLVHEEKHGRDFSRDGGSFEMVQLWVNLPQRHKMDPPRYQGLRASDIPEVSLPGAAGRVRVIAGELDGRRGPARTFTAINLWDVRVSAGKTAVLPLVPGHTTAAVVLDGEASFGDGRAFGAAELVIFTREERDLTISAKSDAKILLLAGEPIDEPVVGYGPFVMSSMDEIRQAFYDYQTGKMGTIGAIAGSE